MKLFLRRLIKAGSREFYKQNLELIDFLFMKTIYPDSVIRQLIYESEEWGRLLAFLKLENAFYKARLAEMIDAIEDERLLMTAEKFNDELLSVDRVIDFLAGELKKQGKLLQTDQSLSAAMRSEMIVNQKKLRNDIQKAEEIFTRNKKAFSDYLSELA